MDKHRLQEIQKQVYQLSTLVAGKFSLQEALDSLAEAAVKIMGVKACSIRLLNEDAGELQMRSTYGLSEAYRNKGVVSKNDPVIKAAFAGKPVVIDDMRNDERVKYRQAAEDENLVSQLTVAMSFKEKPIGVLRMYSPRPKHFTKEDIELARAVASQCAVAITNSRLYHKAIENAHMADQVRLAGIIQRRMIPAELPDIENYDIAATYIPCFDVGGDFYDIYQVNCGCYIVAIADVIGKGMPAAIMMSMFRGAVRAYTDSIEEQCSVTEIVKKLNRMACSECRDGEFITMFYAVLDIEKNILTYCNCGHEPSILFRNEKKKDLDKGGLVLGVEPDTDYETESIKLNPDDLILLYTDGLIDAVNYDGELWGRENLLKVIEKYSDDTAEHIVKNILQYRRRFVGLAQQVDDTSIVAVKNTIDKAGG
jgi:sigma-B regulation protein RsbU (phosphoserine phosphatase)